MNDFSTPISPPGQQEMERAWRRRDPSFDGIFFCAVKTTGIVCRPSCPSRPGLRNVEFFHGLGPAIAAGYRPCKRCRPELVNGQPPEWIKPVFLRMEADPRAAVSGKELQAMNLTPERVRRWFKNHFGLTFAAWCRGHRLSRAFHSIRNGEPLDDVILGHGYESHSGFRNAFQRTFGQPPGKSRQGTCLRVAMLDTELGPVIAAASEASLCLLEFADRRGLELSYNRIKRSFRLPVVPGTNGILDRLKLELHDYFAGKRREFTIQLSLKGTPFQKTVWRELQRIPHGKTISYARLARRVGRPAAVRAVAQANGRNPVSILVPCHRVVASDGSLSGYGGGVWRKRLLLKLEQPTSSSRGMPRNWPEQNSPCGLNC